MSANPPARCGNTEQFCFSDAEAKLLDDFATERGMSREQALGYLKDQGLRSLIPAPKRFTNNLLRFPR